jgi:hypothetical protein
MKISRPFRATLLLSFAAASSGTLLGGSPAIVPEPSAPARWSLSFSPTWHRLGDVSLRSRSRAATFGVPPLLPGDSLIVPPVGSENQIADRTYDDGFVNESAITPVNGMTWYWGYDEATQISGRDLVFHATGSRSDYRAGAADAFRYSNEDDLDGFAPQIDLNIYPEQRPFGIASILISMSYTNTDTSFGFSNFRGSQTQRNFLLNYTDTYDLGAVAPNPPAAPYEGSAGGPGPSIPNKPAHRDIDQQHIGTDRADYANSINSDFDMSALSLAIGPTFEGAFGRHWRWQAAVGTTLTLYDYDAGQSEKLTATSAGGTKTLRRWHDSDSGTHFGVGLFVRGSVLYELNDGWFTSAFLQLETGNSFDLDAGPTATFEVDPNGFSFGVGVGRKF